MFSDFVNNLYAFVSGIPFDSLVWYVWGSYAGIFLLALVLTVFSRRFKAVSKRPFLCLTHAYAGVNLALYLSACELAQSVMITALFWIAGYILFGALCAVSVTAKPKKSVEAAGGTVVTSLPVQIQAPPPTRLPLPKSFFQKTSAKQTVRSWKSLKIRLPFCG